VRWTQTWLAPLPQTESLQAYRGERLGRPRSGPGSVAGFGRRFGAILVDWLPCAVLAQLFTRNPGTSALALFALLIAGIGILNAMQSILAWRRLEIAMLKAIGFRQGTLYLLFGGEALILGLLGGVGGPALGTVASKTISDALARAIGIQINYRLDTVTLLGGIALGAVTTLVFAVLPIVRAASFRPLEILREGTGASAGSWLQTLGLLAFVLLLFAALAATIVGDTLVAVQFVLGAFVVCAILTGVFSVIVGWINALGRPRTPVVGASVLNRRRGVGLGEGRVGAGAGHVRIDQIEIVLNDQGAEEVRAGQITASIFSTLGDKAELTGAVLLRFSYRR